MSNEAPFYVGQKVVCLKTFEPITKGRIYTVDSNVQCDKCGLWHTTVKEHRSLYKYSIMGCSDCKGVIARNTLYLGVSSRRFAPLEYASVTKELAAQVVIGDECDVEINNPVISN